MGSLSNVPTEILLSLSSGAQQCVERLLAYRPPGGRTDWGVLKEAAVLVVLFEKPDSPGLKVLLTTRAKHLRSHPGQTALPGGKMDPEDPSLEYTARREAFEECALPLPPSSHIFHLTHLPPFPSKYSLIVHPYIVLATWEVIRDCVKPSPDEVFQVFDWDLEYLVDLKKYETMGEDLKRKLAVKGSADWMYETDCYSTTDADYPSLIYRMHRFRTTHTPIKGLTSDILIKTAEVAFDKTTSFAKFPDHYKHEKKVVGGNDFEASVERIYQESLVPGWAEKRKAEAMTIQH